VGDAATNTAGYSADLDLPNQTNSANYVYNSIGELVENKQEGLGYEYNSAGLVTRVYELSTSNSLTEYTYNDKGLKYSKTSYSGGLFSVETEQLFYVYDAGGAEVAAYKKLVQLPNDVYALQHHTLYGAGRVGLLDKSTGKALFELSDHLGNVRAVVAEGISPNLAEVLSYTDYYPHGGTLPGRTYQSSLNFPYGYQGQEKDQATGLTNFELRQYDPRIGRWYNPDPYGQHHSPYLAMSNNPVSFTDPDGGWDAGYGADDAQRDAWFAYYGGAQNAFINGDADSYVNGLENMALVSHAYSEYRAEHYNSELGLWGSWQTGSAHTTYGGETVSEAFVVDPKKKKENPVLFKLNQLNGGGLDFSGAKFGMSSYQNLPWYKTRADVFGTNSAKSAWNQAVEMTETVANTLFSSSGRQDVFAGVDNLVKGTMNWLFTTSTDQKVDDILDAGTNIHNYENLAGGIGLGYGIGKFAGIGVNPKILDGGATNGINVAAEDMVFTAAQKEALMATTGYSRTRIINGTGVIDQFGFFRKGISSTKVNLIKQGLRNNGATSVKIYTNAANAEMKAILRSRMSSGRELFGLTIKKRILPGYILGGKL